MTISDALARDAYIYAYSIDKAYSFLYETTIEPGRPFNEFQKLRDLADDTYTAHPTINNDTLHLQGWFDVAAEPVVVTVPDFDEGRYWILHTMDLGHYTNAMIGSRVRKTKGGTFLFAASDWDGAIPDSVDEVVRSDSHLIKVMGRIMTVGGPDLGVARSLMDEWTLETLSVYLGEASPPPEERRFPDPESSTWLERVNFVLADGSMARADAEWLTRFTALGLEAGRADFTEEQRAAAVRGEELGLAHLKELAPTLTNSKQVLGTREELGSGPRDLFAVGTLIGQWGLPPVESVYVKIEVGSDGLPLNGSGGKCYRATFDAPDVTEFWSFTAYGLDSRLMEHNSLNRHSRGDRTMTRNEDGTFSLLLGSEVEYDGEDPNFLPIPEKDTYLILRLYGPSEAIQNGEYAAPEFTVVD
ncbi:DUF1254 domain-containing protein [Brevibacterium permense]|uniref:DUF1254 domain-containing protein n=1 Tax=Brevibacterium permense TaxID=234834 RepID=UPI0021D08A26